MKWLKPFDFSVDTRFPGDPEEGQQIEFDAFEESGSVLPDLTGLSFNHRLRLLHSYIDTGYPAGAMSCFDSLLDPLRLDASREMAVATVRRALDAGDALTLLHALPHALPLGPEFLVSTSPHPELLGHLLSEHPQPVSEVNRAMIRALAHASPASSQAPAHTNLAYEFEVLREAGGNVGEAVHAVLAALPSRFGELAARHPGHDLGPLLTSVAPTVRDEWVRQQVEHRTVERVCAWLSPSELAPVLPFLLSIDWLPPELRAATEAKVYDFELPRDAIAARRHRM